MAAAFSTVGGYGGNASVVLDPASGLTTGLVDTADGIPALIPQIIPSTGQLAASIVDPVPVSPAIGIPEINAVLVELRVVTQLLHMQMGERAPDLQIMRADELFTSTIGSGVL